MGQTACVDRDNDTPEPKVFHVPLSPRTARAKQRLEEFEKKLAKAEATERTLRATCDETETALKRRDTELESKDEEIRHLQSEREQLEERCEKLEKDLFSSRLAASSSGAGCAELQEKLQELHRLLADEQEAFKAAKVTWEAERQTNSDSIKRLKAMKEDKFAEVSELTKKLMEQRRETEAQKAEVQKVQKTLDNLQKSTHEKDAEQATLTRCLDETRSSAEQLEQELKANAAETEGLAASLAEVQESTEKMEKSLEAKAAECEGLAAKLSEAQSSREEVERRFQTKAAECEELTGSLAEARGAVEGLEKRLKDKTAEHEELVDSLADAATTSKKVSSQLKDKSSEYEALREKLRATEKTLTTERDTLQGEHKALQAAARTLRDELATARNDISTLEESLAGVKSGLQKTETALRDERQSSILAKEEAGKQREDFETQLAAADAQASRTASELAVVQAAFDELKGRFKDGQSELRKAAAEKKELHQRRQSAVNKATLGQIAALRSIDAITPLQQCIADGDAVGLGEAIQEMTPVVEAGEEELEQCYGQFATLILPFYQDAVARLASWQKVLSTLKVITKTCGDAVTKRHVQRLFHALKDGSVIGLDLAKSDEDLMHQAAEILYNYHIQQGGIGNSLQKEILRRVACCRHFQGFDFTDLTCCLSYTDKEEVPDNEFFLKRARSLIDKHEVVEFERILSRLDTVLFFLSFLDKEDLELTYKMYNKLQVGVVGKPWSTGYLEFATAQYHPGQELVDTAGKDLLSEQDVLKILEQLKAPGATSNGHSNGSDGEVMRGLRQIFYEWALVMKDTFNLLVLPHHTQVVCLLVCLEFVRGTNKSLPEAGSLVAEMGTGEGKSAVIATLALYCAVFLGKQVHVVVDDENLVERDFHTFESLFQKFKNKNGEPLTAQLCVSHSRKEAKYKARENVQPRVSDDADIVYCEAKHVQSFYTKHAKTEGTVLRDLYQNRMLIVDEVDALLIDEHQNVPFVYENEDLSAFATMVAEAMIEGTESVSELQKTLQTPSEKRLFRSMVGAGAVSSKWNIGVDYIFDETANKYLRVQNGRVNAGAWSLALEYLNFQHQFQERILYNERLFVMNRPHVLNMYSRIVGLSGSVGSEVERELLRSLYRAEFLKVPPFLTTCRNATYHEADSHGVRIANNFAQQMELTCDIAFEYCAKVPVLVIAKDRQAAAKVAHEMEAVANARSLSGKDVVRSLSRDLYENSPETFKENLFQCTQPMSGRGGKSFRIAVTDPRGARGTDYRVTDPDADRAGGLLLIVQYIPKQSRDWVQYLGRTARQDRRGQWMAVLNAKHYVADIEKTRDTLTPETALETILAWGAAETEGKIVETRGAHNRGLRMNELSEVIAERRLLQDARSKEVMIQLCNDYSKMSIEMINDAAKEIKDLNPKSIPTASMEVGADQGVIRSPCAFRGRSFCSVARAIIILIDRSSSMLSKDAGVGVERKTRFEVCKKCLSNIFENNVEDHDALGLYSFENEVRESFPLTEKGPNKKKLRNAILNIPPPDGLTRFYDGMSTCIEKLLESKAEAKYLVSLTDGDDNMSVSQPEGEKVTALIQAGVKNLNLIMITCGKIKPSGISKMNHWADAVQSSGNIGMHIPAEKPAELAEAFRKVAELMEQEGETEL
eukprot:TRINITY_DN15519_c0_g1_i1.p1 TRINITY_DN15519_c0_g1~~TRINITY_DN15519_c0_g1_i1.p1  ORF type:complete len:1641 (-),score=534.53 TRINITY_DN15519_c0_g1_i1:309-5231(-)